MKVVLGKLNSELLVNVAMRAAPFCSQVDAAVAYAGGPNHQLVRICKEHDIRLNFIGLLDAGGAVNPGLLRELLAWGPSRAEVRLVKGNFHPKVIWWRGYGAYIGSANLTNNGWFNNIEAGVFIDEEELIASGAGSELDALFDHLVEHSVPVTDEVVEKMEQLARKRHRLTQDAQAGLDADFKKSFGHIADNVGLARVPAKGHRENRAAQRFVAEWMHTLQLMRGLAKDFEATGLRPAWVDDDAHPAIHFDQFLHAYYYDYVRGSSSADEDDLKGLEKVESFFKKHRSNPSAALQQAARWWAALPTDRHGEEVFIRETAPTMRARLSHDAVKKMDLPAFKEAIRNVNAFRMHARQVRNTEFGLPGDHHEDMESRVNRLCDWLWRQRTTTGKTVREVLEFVIWGTMPSDMEQRLWRGVWGDEYRLPHFGQSTLGESVGWARPDDYPPRNNRTNKALRALGHDVKLFSRS